MKINIFENVNDDYPDDKIICINDFDTSDLKFLINSIEKIINEGIGFSITNDTKNQNGSIVLTFSTSEIDYGIKQVDNKSFICILTTSKYSVMGELLQHFMKKDIKKGYQWLFDLNSPIELLLSYNCKW